MEARLATLLEAFARGNGQLTVLTGAGVSAESGIPTFRGPEGYWTVGSSHYHPQQMATRQMFDRMPAEVWRWYLYRMAVCAKAGPNPGHYALAQMERRFHDRFTLITQNVDGLHLRAGNSLHRTFMIHGNLFFMRCAGPCGTEIHPTPGWLAQHDRDLPLSDAERAALLCPACGGWTRPHVLWFDESYDEIHFRFESSLAAAGRTGLLIIAGTSGATNLPNLVAQRVFARGGTVIDINIAENPFSGLARSSPGGAFLNQTSATALPQIAEIFGSVFSGDRS
jgi:NAD-dependent deacetylase